MVLSPQEMNALRKLEAKRKQHAEPLTEADLEAMEERCADVFDVSALTDLQEFWNRWCERFRGLSADNLRLVAEVRRLTQTDKTPRETRQL